MGALFDGVRGAVSAEEVALKYGLFPSGWKKKALCPWHSDKNPSLSFDRRTGRCRCFACNNGGSAVDLTAQLFGLSFLDAAKKLNVDFQLGLDTERSAPPIGEPPVQKRQHELERQRRLWKLGVDIREIGDELLKVYGDRDTPLLWDILELRELGVLAELAYR